MKAGESLSWKLVNEETLWQGFFQLKKYEIEHQRFDGQNSGLIQREVFERGDAVAVILLDPLQQKLLMVEQFRPGAIRHQQSPWLIEPVAGMIEPGESPAEVVRRETLEETGCQVKRLRKIYEYLVSPGGCSEKIWLYLGEIDSSQAVAIAGLEDEHEDIRVHLLSLGEAFERLETGEFNNAMSFVGLQWLQLQLLQNKDLWPENRLE